MRARLRALWFIAMAGCSSPAEAQPARPAKTYTLQKPVSDALAKEKLAGNVLVRNDAVLYATAAAARDDAKPATSNAVAMKVVADHGDVVEVSTGPTKDCIDSWDEPYQLRVFVKRDKLTPRLKAEITKTFSDGTAVAIDRGAPVTVSADGLQWETLDVEAAVPPREDQLAFSVPAMTKPATLPATPKSERLVCNGTPTPHAEWLQESKRDQDARFREGTLLQQQIGTYEHWCGIHDPAQYEISASPSTVSPPTVDGKPVKWPWVWKDDANQNVVRSGSAFLGDVQFRCGRVRMSVAAEGVRSAGGTGTGIGGGKKIKVWVPSAGPVTWLDGTPAGTYSGGRKYKDVVVEAKRICVRVVNVAEPVCFAKARVKTAMHSWELY